MNFCANVIKFTTPNTTITIAALLTSAEPDMKQHQLLFQVRDEGNGISTEKIELLFKKFSQVHSDSQGGSGLGLAI